jgi:branched-chain amino acid transport system substrate-binding protein
MKRFLAGTAVVIAGALALSGCAGASSGASSGSTEPIPVGLIAPLTGPGAPFGVPVRAAIEARVAQINDGGGVNGRPLELTIKDDTTDPTAAAAAATELVADGVVSVVGPVTSSTALAAAPITATAGVPALVFAAAPIVTDPDEPYYAYTWRAAPNDADAVPLTIERISDMGVKKIAVMAQDDANGALGLEVIKNLAAEKGIEVVATATAALTATDTLAQATAIRDAKPELVVLQLTSVGLASTFLRAAQDVGLDVPFLGGTGLGQPALLKAAGAAAEGLTVLNFLDPSNLTAAQKAFYDQMIADGGEPVYTFSEIMAVAAVDILVEAMKKASEITPAGINAALDAGVSADSIALAPVEFSATDHDFFSPDALVWTTVENGKFTAAS